MEWALIAGMAVLAVLALGWLVYRRWFKLTDLQRLVRNISHENLTNVFLPDGLGGEIYIDHLLLTPRGLLLIDVKDVSGTVFAGDRLDEWSANSPTGRVSFDNPIPQLQDRTSAVRLLVPGTPIDAKIIFVNEVTFPKGHPESVSTLEILGNDYARVDDADGSGLYVTAWETITGSARPI